MKVAITGGGTGGHIYPALAVAEALRREVLSTELLYIGGERGPEVDIVPQTGIRFEAVRSRKLRKLVSPSTVGVLLELWKGYREAGALLKSFGADVVIGTGGYVAAATSIAATRQGRPLIIQACDAVPGRTNRWLSRRASRVCIWFAETAERLPGAKTVQTGVPLRPDIVSRICPEEARVLLGMSPDQFTVLVVGGSQGAQRLNELAIGMASLLDGPVQVLHQTGPRNHEEALKVAERTDLSRINYLPRPYISGEQMPLAYRAADLVVCRCGISTLAEITANGVPALMVPLPTAYADHQTANARAVERAGAGIHLRQPELTPERLAEQVQALRGDEARREAMAAAGRALGRPEAARHVAELARECAG